MCSPLTPSHKAAVAVEAPAKPQQPLNMALIVPQAINQAPEPRQTVNEQKGEEKRIQRPSASQVRTRYLSRLGIAPSPPSKKITTIRRSRPIPQTVKEPLKDDDRDSSPSGRSKPTSIKFHDSVSVVAIPMRKEYSPRIRKDLWGDRSESVANAKRNAIEFAAEGWDWRTVKEEDEMAVGRNGERIHPIHLYQQQRCNGVQRQFFMHLSRAPAL